MVHTFLRGNAMSKTVPELTRRVGATCCRDLLLFLSHVKQGKSFSIGLFILSGGIWTTKNRVSEILNNVVVQATWRCWRELCEISLQHFKMCFWQSKTGRFISHPIKVVFELCICPKLQPLHGHQPNLISRVKLGNSPVLSLCPHLNFHRHTGVAPGMYAEACLCMFAPKGCPCHVSPSWQTGPGSSEELQ